MNTRTSVLSVVRLPLGLVLLLTMIGSTLIASPRTVLADTIPPPISNEVCVTGQLEFGPVETNQVVRTAAGEEVSFGYLRVRNSGAARELMTVQFFGSWSSGSPTQLQFFLDPGEEKVIAFFDYLPAGAVIDNVIIEVDPDDEYCAMVGYTLVAILPLPFADLADDVRKAAASDLIDLPFDHLLPAHIDRARWFMIQDRPRAAAKQLLSFIVLTKVGMRLGAVPEELGQPWIDAASQTIEILGQEG